MNRWMDGWMGVEEALREGFIRNTHCMQASFLPKPTVCLFLPFHFPHLPRRVRPHAEFEIPERSARYALAALDARPNANTNAKTPFPAQYLHFCMCVCVRVRACVWPFGAQQLFGAWGLFFVTCHFFLGIGVTSLRRQIIAILSRLSPSAENQVQT